jgi:hypothetical protein
MVGWLGVLAAAAGVAIMMFSEVRT